MTRFEGKVALVTGVDAEIGRAIAVAFAREGAAIAGCCRSADKGRETILAIERSGGKAALIEGNAARDGDSELAVKRAVDELGRLDVLVNYGAARRVVGTVMEISDEDFAEEMDADLKSVIALSRRAIPIMAKNGGGAIVNLSSIARSGVKGRALRSASKAALSSLTRAMALDHGPQNIRVNAVLLGPTLTSEMARRPEQVKLLEEESALKTLHTPEDVAAAVLFLASDDARRITGVLLPVDAGRSLPRF
ncbi:MAG: SDR family NAD(P)-dependent oxidoreductase [Candidatus Binatia bacterium]